MKYFSRKTRVLLINSVLLLSACASTQYQVDYEVEPSQAKIWPSPPNTARYRYVGQLTGEKDLKEIEGSKSFGTRIADFFKMLVGLGGENSQPLVLQRPQSGLTDPQGRVLVTDVSRHSVVVFDLAKGTLTEWHQATPTIDFITPIAITLGPKSTYYVSDAQLQMVVQLDENGNPIKQIGEGLLKRPTGLAIDPFDNRIFVSDTRDHNIKVFNEMGELVDVMGKRGTKPGEFNGPTHLWFARGNLYVTDTFNTRVQIFSQTGDFKSQFGKRGRYVGNFVRPKGITTDSDGNIYVIESLHDRLLVYNANGDYLLPIGGTGSGIGEFYLPAGVWSDNNDRIYIADMFNGRIVILQYLDEKGSHHSVQ